MAVGAEAGREKKWCVWEGVGRRDGGGGWGWGTSAQRVKALFLTERIQLYDRQTHISLFLWRARERERDRDRQTDRDRETERDRTNERIFY